MSSKSFFFSFLVPEPAIVIVHSSFNFFAISINKSIPLFSKASLPVNEIFFVCRLDNLLFLIVRGL